MRKSLFLFLVVSIVSGIVHSQEKHLIYLLSGQGSDERIFQEMDWDQSAYDGKYVEYLVPNRGEQMPEYAQRIAQAIDTSRSFSLVGVSLGGMIAMELTDIVNPKHVIIISSAKSRSELPLRYRFQRYIPIYALVPKGLIKVGAQIAQPLFEPDRKSHKQVFKAMLKAKDKTFMKRSIRMIVNWQRMQQTDDVFHIHGDNDHTLSIKKINDAHIIKNGSHMMALTRAKEVSKMINEYLSQGH